MALDVIELRDPATGSSARILPGFGFNCFSFQPVVRGEAFEVLWSVANFSSGQERPSHSGIPLLFPFPGRIGGTDFEFQGRRYALTAADGRGNAIHGFVLNRAWEVTEQSATHAVGIFQASRHAPEVLDHWPADFRLSVRYELRGNCLASTIDVVNPSSTPLPFGLGTHPYFRVPLGKGGQAAECTVQVPVSDVWVLENMLPTGERKACAGRIALASGVRFADTQLDDVFSGLVPSDGPYVAHLRDPHSQREIRIAFAGAWKAAVVYNPPHREAICVEPYSCIPDPFALEQRGIDSGLIVLQPGEQSRFTVDIGVA